MFARGLLKGRVDNNLVMLDVYGGFERACSSTQITVELRPFQTSEKTDKKQPR